MKRLISIAICSAIPFVLSANVIAQENDSPFELTAYPVAGELQFLYPVWSLQSGLIGATASLAGTRDDDRRTVQFHVNNGRLEVLHDSLYRNPSNQVLRMLLGNGQVLVYETHPGFSSSDDPRTNRSYLVLDSSSGESIDVTPSNMLDTPEWKIVIGPRTLWSEEYGLALLYYDPDTRKMVLWQGKEIASEVTRTPPIMAKGMTYIDGRFTYAYLTDDGQIFVYDWNTGRLEESPVHAAVGSEIAKVIAPRPNGPPVFMLANEVALFRAPDRSSFALVGSAGEQFVVQRIQEEDITQQEFLDSLPSTLTEEEIEAALIDWELLIDREKGFSQPASVVGGMTVFIPVDDTHVGLLDSSYQRLILIGPGN